MDAFAFGEILQQRDAFRRVGSDERGVGQVDDADGQLCQLARAWLLLGQSEQCEQGGPGNEYQQADQQESAAEQRLRNETSQRRHRASPSGMKT